MKKQTQTKSESTPVEKLHNLAIGVRDHAKERWLFIQQVLAGKVEADPKEFLQAILELKISGEFQDKHNWFSNSAGAISTTSAQHSIRPILAQQNNMVIERDRKGQEEQSRTAHPDWAKEQKEKEKAAAEKRKAEQQKLSHELTERDRRNAEISRQLYKEKFPEAKDVVVEN